VTATISASMVKELRDKTGAGMMDAKNALVEANGDMEKASEILRQKGIATAEKKSGRAAAEGLVVAKIISDGKTGVLVEVNCETDFVARGESFQQLAESLAEHILSSKAGSVEAVLKEKSKPAPQLTVDDYIKEHVGVIKENLSLRRFTRYELKEPGFAKLKTIIGILVSLQRETAV